MNRQAREANPQTPVATTLARAALSGVDPTRAPAVGVTNVAPATTPQAVTLTTPQPGNGTLPLTFTCAEGWTAQNVTGRRYAFCTPPGWSARIGAANTPRAGEPEGSAVQLEHRARPTVLGRRRSRSGGANC